MKASLDPKGEGRKLRRARNKVRRYLGTYQQFEALKSKHPDIADELQESIRRMRYEQAQTLLVTAALLKD